MKFDTYTWRARLLPTICFMIPLFIEMNVLIVKIGFKIAISTTIINIFLFLILFLLSNWIRHLGRKREKMLFDEWGGAPTTRFLRCYNDEYNAYKKEEIKKYLKMMFNNLSMPTEEEEKTDLGKTDKMYEAYIINLKALTRNPKEFSLLQEENRNYGMLRNLYGVKFFELGILIFFIILNILLFFISAKIMSLQSMVVLNSIYVFIGFVWLLIVTKSKIKDAADCYAERLLETVILLNKNRTKK